MLKNLNEILDKIPDNAKGRILKSVLLSVMLISKEAKNIPKVTKFKRNIFIKTYNRRPQNKKKTAMSIVKMAVISAMGAAQIEIIKQTPIPKYGKGTF